MKLDKGRYSDRPAGISGSECPKMKHHSTSITGDAGDDRSDAEQRHRPCEARWECPLPDGMAQLLPRIWQWQCPSLQHAQQAHLDMPFRPIRTCTITGLPHAPSERSSIKACSRLRINRYPSTGGPDPTSTARSEYEYPGGMAAGQSAADGSIPAGG